MSNSEKQDQHAPEHHPEHAPEHHTQEHHPDYRRDVFNEQEFTLMDLVLVLWRRRYLLIASTGAFAAFVALFVLLTVSRAPTRTETSLRFKLNFPEAENGKYPNGLNFSLNDIVAGPILDSVYFSMGLSDHITRTQFRDSLLVSKSTEGLKFIEQKYASLLDPNSRLSPGERERFREEYEAEKEKFYAQADYVITYSAAANGLPASLRGEALHKVLEEWARFSDERRGVQLYPVSVTTDDVFDDIGKQTAEPLLQLDKMRQVLKQIRESATDISRLPGAVLVRTDAGASIESAIFRLGSLQQYELQPLEGIVRQRKLYRDVEQVKAYLEQHIYTLELEAKKQEGKVELLEQSLDTYMRGISMPRLGEAGAPLSPGLSSGSLIPQIGEGFLDRLIAMADETRDAEYRQQVATQIVTAGTSLLEIQQDIAFYQDLLPKPEEQPVAGSSFETVAKDFQALLEDVVARAKDLNGICLEIYRIVSNRNLKGEQLMYSVISPPVAAKSRAMSPKRMLVFAAVAIFLFFWMVAFAVLAMERLRAETEFGR